MVSDNNFRIPILFKIVKRSNKFASGIDLTLAVPAAMILDYAIYEIAQILWF